MFLKFFLQSDVPQPPAVSEDMLQQFLSFFYTLAHWVGNFVVNLLDNALDLKAPANLIDPIGFLVLLTGFLIIAEVAKKVAWLILVVGWALILVKIVLDANQATTQAVFL